MEYSNCAVPFFAVCQPYHHLQEVLEHAYRLNEGQFDGIDEEPLLERSLYWKE